MPSFSLCLLRPSSLPLVLLFFPSHLPHFPLSVICLIFQHSVLSALISKLAEYFYMTATFLHVKCQFPSLRLICQLPPQQTQSRANSSLHISVLVTVSSTFLISQAQVLDCFLSYFDHHHVLLILPPKYFLSTCLLFQLHYCLGPSLATGKNS